MLLIYSIETDKHFPMLHSLSWIEISSNVGDTDRY